MTPVLERLIDVLLEVWRVLIPWVVLPDDQVGLVRRLGVCHRKLRHGLNWKIPIVETAMVETSALDSVVLREQSLTTKDGQSVTLRGVITYRVVDPVKYIVEVDNPLTVVNDVGCCVIGELVPELTAADVLRGPGFLATLTRRIKARAKHWGVEVQSCGLADATIARTIRLLGGRDV